MTEGTDHNAKSGLARVSRREFLKLVAAAGLLAGCAPAPQPTPIPTSTLAPTPAPTVTPEPTVARSPEPVPIPFVYEDAFPGWTPDGEVEVFDRETIYHLVDGQAQVFLVYGLEQVAVQRYENGEGTWVDVQVWQLATPYDAYGLFTMDVSGVPVDIGNDGDLDPGRRLAFWQDRYTVWVGARPQLDDAELRRFGEAFSEALPQGGERPPLMGQLPPGGLVERGAVFFHQEISIQDRLWLGGQNLLGLGPETDGVLARYEVGGAAAWLLLIQYPGEGAAAAGLAALAGGQVDDLVAADARDGLLGAVLGEVNEATASDLLAEALGSR